MANAVEVQDLCGQFDRREICYAQFIEDCTRMIAAAIGCSRAGVWLFDDTFDGRQLRCLGVFDRNKNRMTLVPDENHRQVGPYFDALEEDGHVLAVDARTHPATAGLFSEQLSANGVRSLMAASCSINGRQFGAFTCSNVGETMNWSPTQLATLKRIGSRVSLALAGATRTSQPTLPMPL
jgi:GAF domain-containing protein